MDFWEKFLEPNMATKYEVREGFQEVGNRLDRVERKLDAQISAQDRLETRLKKVEEKVKQI